MFNYLSSLPYYSKKPDILLLYRTNELRNNSESEFFTRVVLFYKLLLVYGMS